MENDALDLGVGVRTWRGATIPSQIFMGILREWTVATAQGALDAMDKLASTVKPSHQRVHTYTTTEI